MYIEKRHYCVHLWSNREVGTIQCTWMNVHTQSCCACNYMILILDHNLLISYCCSKVKLLETENLTKMAWEFLIWAWVYNSLLYTCRYLISSTLMEKSLCFMKTLQWEVTPPFSHPSTTTGSSIMISRARHSLPARLKQERQLSNAFR